VKRKILKYIYLIENNLFSAKIKILILKLFPFIYKFAVYLRWKSFIKPGDTVVQAGVDMGWKHTKRGSSNVIYMAKLVGTFGKVIAIEPDKENIRKLESYLKSHNLNNVIIIKKALWKEKGTLRFLMGKRANDNLLAVVPNTHKIASEIWKGEIQIAADTLDNILKDQGVNHVSHICLTINGAELEALKGSHKTLQSEKLTLLIAAKPWFRPIANGMPYNKKIALLLKSYDFITKIGKNGWISAYK